MIGFLSESDVYIRGLAVVYLGKRKLKTVIPYLIKLLNDKAVFVTFTTPPPPQVIKITVRDRAIEALESITGIQFGTAENREEQVKEWLNWWHTQEQKP